MNLCKVCETNPDCPFISKCQDNINISTYGDVAEGKMRFIRGRGVCMMDYKEVYVINYAEEIINKYSDILSKLEEERVFKLVVDESYGGSIDIMECCDKWFGYSLTKDDCENLSLLFSELSKVV